MSGVKGVVRPAKLNPRALERRQSRDTPRSFHGKIPGGDSPPPSSSDRKKRELMEAARNAGWRGKVFHSAQKFERRLELATHLPTASAPGTGKHSCRRRR